MNKYKCKTKLKKHTGVLTAPTVETEAAMNDGDFLILVLQRKDR